MVSYENDLINDLILRDNTNISALIKYNLEGIRMIPVILLLSMVL